MYNLYVKARDHKIASIGVQRLTNGDSTQSTQDSRNQML